MSQPHGTGSMPPPGTTPSHVCALPGGIQENLFLADEAQQTKDLLAAVDFIIVSTAEGPSISDAALRGASNILRHIVNRIELYICAESAGTLTTNPSSAQVERVAA